MNVAQAYQVLGLSPGCSERDLSVRFRQLAQQTHPDAGGSALQFSEVSQAYVIALDDLDRVVRDAMVVTTHVTSWGGRLRRAARQVQRRVKAPALRSHIPNPGGRT